MELKLFAVLVIVILVVAVSISIGEGDSEAIPPNTVGFLGGGWHPAPECIQCHVSLLSEGALRAKLGSCECHRETYTSGGKIDNEKIRENAHGIKACIDCHIGSGIATSAGEVPSDEIHRPHVSLDCQACHGERESITIPEKGNCDFCHLGDAHFVHGNKTGDLCVVCHGSFGLKYKEVGYQMKEGVPVEKKPEEVTYPTISNILKAVIELIFKQGEKR
ncbi:hypothetical protein ES705_08361 [subsurface metagenome]|nr:hypothetical protein [Methanosarcinales archaeon]